MTPSSGFELGGLRGKWRMRFATEYCRIQTTGGSPICQIGRLLDDSGISFAAKNVSNRVTCGKPPKNIQKNSFLSNERYWMASRMSLARMFSTPA